MIDFVILAIVVIIVGLAIRYIVRAKKAGVTCIGCPDSKTCHHSKGGKCSCHHTENP